VNSWNYNNLAAVSQRPLRISSIYPGGGHAGIHHLVRRLALSSKKDLIPGFIKAATQMTYRVALIGAGNR
jgi:hypothetical protein